MGFSIHYRSTDTMHPVQAYDIKQHAQQLVDGYAWFSCEPVALDQRSDGYLAGHSKPNFFPAESSDHPVDADGLPDGTVLTLAEVLCVLSRDHSIDWDIGHDYEPQPIGRICGGVAEEGLIEQLETFGSIGDLLDDMLDDDDEDDEDWDEEDWDEEECDSEVFGDKEAKTELGLVAEEDDSHSTPAAQVDPAELDDPEPRVLKFPGVDH